MLQAPGALESLAEQIGAPPGMGRRLGSAEFPRQALHFYTAPGASFGWYEIQAASPAAAAATHALGRMYLPKAGDALQSCVYHQQGYASLIAPTLMFAEVGSCSMSGRVLVSVCLQG